MKKLYLILSFLFFSCDSWKSPIVNNYYLIAIDLRENLSICYATKTTGCGVSVIPQTILAVGHNEDFIIAQSSYGGGMYFIIPSKDKVHKFPDENKLGPFREEEFILKKKELGISSLKFNRFFEDGIEVTWKKSLNKRRR